MQFQLPRYAPPGSFSPSDTYMQSSPSAHDPSPPARQNLMFQLPQGLPPQTWGQPQQIQQDQQQALSQQQPQQGAGIAAGGSMAQFQNPSLGNAMKQYPSGLGDYLNRGMGGAPGTGMPQRMQGPRQMSANPQFNRIAGVRMS